MAAHLFLHEPLIQVLNGGQVFRMASRGTRAAHAQAQRQEAHCAGYGEPTMPGMTLYATWQRFLHNILVPLASVSANSIARRLSEKRKLPIHLWGE